MKRFFIFALVATVFAACSTDATQDVAPEIPTSPDELYVAFAEEDSRVQLGENGAPVWTEGDLVSVFYRSNANDKYQFTGKTGDAEGSIKLVESGTPTVATPRIVAVYPYSTSYWFNWETYNVEAFLPAEQTYLKDSYGVNSSIMISSSSYKQLSFKNVCGWLKLQFTGRRSVSKIVLRGNCGEQVAGEIYINSADASCILASEMGESGDGTGGNIAVDGTILTSVTLNCGNGVALNSETPTAFYIALPPQTFNNGISITVTCADGLIMNKSTSNKITIQRNHILPMASIEVKRETPEASKCEVDLTASNIKWNYADDAQQDAVALNGGDANYNRYGIRLSVTSSNLPEDIKVEDLILSGAPVSTMVIGNGTIVDNVYASISGNETDGYALALSNFTWNTEYTITFKYSLAHLDANVIINIATIDRKRDAIVKIERSFDYTYQQDLSFEPFDGVAPEMAINSVYTDIAALYDIAAVAEADFLKEVFVTKAPFAVEDVVAPAANLDYLFNYAGNKVSVAYAYNAWAEVPLEVTYTKNINLWYGQEVELVIKVVISKPTNYNLVYSSLYVQSTGNGLAVQALPDYMPILPTSSLMVFEMSPIDLDKAFNIVDGNREILTEEEIAAAGLVAEFELEQTYDFSAYNEGKDYEQQRWIQWSWDGFGKTNKLDYHANIAEVPITGRLYIQNSDGSRTQLTTNFDNNNAYKNFVVKGYNPISSASVTNCVYAINARSEYVLRVLDYVSVNDYRNGYTNYPLIKNGSWVVGDGTNGFASGRSVSDIYGINVSIGSPSIPGALSTNVYIAANGCLIIDNLDASVSSYLIANGNVSLRVPVTISTAWGSQTVYVPFTLVF